MKQKWDIFKLTHLSLIILIDCHFGRWQQHTFWQAHCHVTVHQSHHGPDGMSMHHFLHSPPKFPPLVFKVDTITHNLFIIFSSSLKIVKFPTIPPKSKGKEGSKATQAVTPKKRVKKMACQNQPPPVYSSDIREDSNNLEGLWAIQQRQNQDWPVWWICLWIYPMGYKPPNTLWKKSRQTKWLKQAGGRRVCCATSQHRGPAASHLYWTSANSRPYGSSSWNIQEWPGWTMMSRSSTGGP